MIVTSSAGKPTVSKTMTIVIKPACGIPAAPILAAVAVTLLKYKLNHQNMFIKYLFYDIIYLTAMMCPNVSEIPLN